LCSGAYLNKLLFCGAKRLRIAQSKGCSRLGASLPKMETEPASEMSCFFKKLDDGQNYREEELSVNFSHAVFSLLLFLTLEDGTDSMSHNVGKELHLYFA